MDSSTFCPKFKNLGEPNNTAKYTQCVPESDIGEIEVATASKCCVELLNILALKILSSKLVTKINILYKYENIIPSLF